MPRFRLIGFAPAVTFFSPSRKIACARTVAVVVPSPARSLVLVATSFTICAPMFSIGSSSSTSFATVTPSLVISGEPNLRSITTLRPFGPSVTFTASASLSTPFFSAAARLGVEHQVLRSHGSLSSIVRGRLAESLQPITASTSRLAQDQVLLVLQRHLGPAVLPVEHLVAHLQLHRDRFPSSTRPGAHGDDFPLLRLLLRGIRDVQPAAHLLLLLQRLDDDAVRERLDLEIGRGSHRS